MGDINSIDDKTFKNWLTGAGVLVSLLTGVLLTGGRLAFADDSTDMDPQLKSLKCSKEMSSMLDQWEPKRQWRHQAPSNDGAKVDRSPTDEVGIWVETRVYPDKTVEAFRITPHTTTIVSWKNENCVPALRVDKRGYDPERMKKAFTDADLEQLVKTGKAGVIYAWSPHMPLSVDGMKEIDAAAKKFDVKVYKVLDPHASPKEAARVARKMGLKNVLKPIESIELFNRGIGNHYPCIVMFNKGKILAQVVPGLKDESHYERYIKENLEK